MVSQARLHDAFGEIIYAVAIADGLIQEEELKLIDEKLAHFSWGEDAKWSFNWERKKETQLKDAYLKALDTLKENGPTSSYYDLINILEEVAKASDGFEKKEGQVISIFNKSLKSHFLEFLNDNGLNNG
ncbi:MAG: TerB family tellurite resistance protein [Saprospiraceae bacterium]